MGSGGAIVRLCGRLSVEIAGEAHEGMPHGRQGRLLLAFLCVTPKLPEPVWIDVEAAHAALERARRDGDPAASLAAAQEAAELVEPELFPGLDAPWLGEQRVALEHVRVEALEIAARTAQTIEPALAETYARARTLARSLPSGRRRGVVGAVGYAATGVRRRSWAGTSRKSLGCRTFKRRWYSRM